MLNIVKINFRNILCILIIQLIAYRVLRRSWCILHEKMCFSKISNALEKYVLQAFSERDGFVALMSRGKIKFSNYSIKTRKQ